MWQGVGHRVTVKEISGQWNGENQLKMDNALKYVCARHASTGPVQVYNVPKENVETQKERERKYNLIEGNNNLPRLCAFYNVL